MLEVEVSRKASQRRQNSRWDLRNTTPVWVLSGIITEEEMVAQAWDRKRWDPNNQVPTQTFCSGLFPGILIPSTPRGESLTRNAGKNADAITLLQQERKSVLRSRVPGQGLTGLLGQRINQSRSRVSRKPHITKCRKNEINGRKSPVTMETD